jgi:hypothetical protein
MFIVKKLNKHGKWDTISLYDENNSSRGKTRFETKKKLRIISRYTKIESTKNA